MINAAGSLFDPVFLHFFDIHFLEERGIDPDHPKAPILDEMRLATRLAVAVADLVYVPAASYIESAVCKLVLDELRDLFAFGTLELVGSATNLDEFKESKLTSYRKNSPIYSRYSTLLKGEPPSFRSKHSSTTQDLGAYWKKRLMLPDTLPNLVHGTGVVLPKDFEKTWDRVPERLGSLAFVPEHVNEQLGKIKHTVLENRVRTVINQGYFASYAKELNATVVDDLVYLGAGYAIPVAGRRVPYRAILRELQRRDSTLLNHLRTCSPLDLLRIRDEPKWSECVRESLKKKIGGRAPATYSIAAREIDVLILTALDEERAPFETYWPGAETYTDEFGNVVRWATVVRGGSQSSLFPYSVALTTLPKMGRVAAATTTTQLLTYLRPKCVFLVGIAGGVEVRAKLGDVLIASPIVDYEHQKLHPTEPEYRFEHYNASPMLLNAIKNVKPIWHSNIGSTRPGPGTPGVHIGPVGSGDKLVQDWSAFGELKRRHPKLLGVEMEGGGAAHAASAVPQIPHFLMVRGVSDYADPDKATAATKAWRPYACSVAAAFTVALMRQGLLK